MKVSVLLTLLLFTFLTSDDFPSAKITNGLITATLHLPDAEKGYYRGIRFDWSGVMPSLEYKGHQYFGLWNPAPYDPKLHDAITGPVEEFVAVGLQEAATGGEFVKIGVGSLIKPDDQPWAFTRKYEIKNPGQWTVKKKKDRVEFTHVLTDVNGYAYEYQKVVKLEKGKPELVLEHSLRNTGIKPIETSTYNHNFFVIDGEPTGPNISTTFPYEVSAEGKGFGTIAEAKNNAIVYNRTLNKGENVFTTGIQGIEASPQNYDFTIRNLKTRAGVHIKGDRPLEKLVYWSNPNTSCPEPYIRIAAKPGETTRWTVRYTFDAPGQP
jgi:ribosomal protein S8E